MYFVGEHTPVVAASRQALRDGGGVVLPHGTEDSVPVVRPHEEERVRNLVRYGSSPRGAQALVECGRVHALMHGRFHLAIEDVRHVGPSVLRHRIILNFDAHADGQTPETILQAVVKSVTAQASVA